MTEKGRDRLEKFKVVVEIEMLKFCSEYGTVVIVLVVVVCPIHYGG